MMNRKHHWLYHAILCGAALLASIAPSLAQQKSDTKSGVPQTLISTAPQHLLFGINLGVERALSPNFLSVPILQRTSGFWKCLT